MKKRARTLSIINDVSKFDIEYILHEKKVSKIESGYLFLVETNCLLYQNMQWINCPLQIKIRKRELEEYALTSQIEIAGQN